MARIRSNAAAMMTHRMYNKNSKAVGKNAEKLASGYRINRSADDAAGLAISEKMRAQIRGLTMASKNCNDAIGAIQTAEGALQETQNMLQRINELAVQAASDTNTSIDRESLQLEVSQLLGEIDQVAYTTKFNEIVLLDGEITSAKGIAGPIMPNPPLSYGTLIINFNNTAISNEMKKMHNYSEDKYYTINAETNGNILNFTVLDDDGTKYTVGSVTFPMNGDYTRNREFPLNGNLGTVSFTSNQNATNALNGTDIANALNGRASTFTFNIKSNPLIAQVGAEAGNTLEITIDAMHAEGLGVDKIDISTREGASSAIATARYAITMISNQRADLGAYHNRLEHKINNLGTTVENLTAAESGIRDADMASEMSKFTKNNILTQAATAMLAQANALPQNVLQLLG